MLLFKKHKFKVLLLIFLWIKNVNAQEMNSIVTVNSSLVSVSNNQIFKTLEKDLSDFINLKKWTDVKFKEHEKIKCGINIIIKEQTSTNTFTGSIQIQASRPVYNTSYYTPIINFNDDKFTFEYKEFQPLNYNPTIYESNLVSVMSFYTYTILGVYVNSFELNKGNEYLKVAQNIANQAQQSGQAGWENSRNNISRFTLIDQMLSESHAPYNKFMYEYHYNGLDGFEKTPDRCRATLYRSIIDLDKYNTEYPNNFLVRFVLDAKADEIVNVFKQTSFIDDMESFVEVLKKMSPSNSKLWKKIIE